MLNKQAILFLTLTFSTTPSLPSSSDEEYEDLTTVTSNILNKKLNFSETPLINNLIKEAISSITTKTNVKDWKPSTNNQLTKGIKIRLLSKKNLQVESKIKSKAKKL
jgi:hypothetical protein